MYSRTNVDEIDERDLDGIEPGLKAVGYELRPDEMRPSVWAFEAGESNNRHKHEAQEELYFVVDGRFEMDVEDETFEVGAGEFVVVERDAWRQLTALEESTLFVVGAPNVEGDAVSEE